MASAILMYMSIGVIWLQCALAIHVAELPGGIPRVASEEATHEGEVGEVVFVADLLHRLLGVLEG